MEVWLAIIRPDTLLALSTYGLFLDSATCMLAGPRGMNRGGERGWCAWMWGLQGEEQHFQAGRRRTWPGPRE